MLYCQECGCCSGELGKGWVAYTCHDPVALVLREGHELAPAAGALASPKVRTTLGAVPPGDPSGHDPHSF